MFLCLMFLCLAIVCQAQQSQLIDRSPKDLMNIKVTSGSKTGEDIRRSGATNIPDLLLHCSMG
jgi:hypothetical protein